MRQSSLLSLHKIEVVSFSYGIKKKRGLKKETLLSGDELDFEFIPQAKKKGSEKKRLIFSLKTNERSSFVNFEVTVVMDYSFLVDKTPGKEVVSIVGLLLPQVISFLRGYLLASTTNSPTTVVLPFINMIESIKEKQPEFSASPVEKE
jgi:hypothetical protein